MGAPTTIGLDNGTAMKGKGKQFVPHGNRVMMAFPGGAGYGLLSERKNLEIWRDLAAGYISEQAAIEAYGLDPDIVKDVMKRARNGEVF
jgi:N-methylhydantoinase B